MPKTKIAKKFLLAAAVCGLLTFGAFVRIRVSKGQVGGTVYVAITTVEGSPGSGSFGVYNGALAGTTQSIFGGCSLSQAFPVINANVTSDDTSCAVPANANNTIGGNSAKPTLIAVTTPGSRSCATTLHVNETLIPQSGFTPCNVSGLQNFDVPAFVAVTPFNMPYTALSSKKTFTAAPGLIAAGAAARLTGHTAVTFQNISGGALTITPLFQPQGCLSSPLSLLTLAPGASGAFPLAVYFNASCVSQYATFTNTKDADDALTVPVTETLVPPGTITDNDGNNIPSAPAFTFPPSPASTTTTGATVSVIAHGDPGGFGWDFSFNGSIFSGIAPVSLSYDGLAPGGTYSYYLNGIFLNLITSMAQYYPAGTVGFIAPSLTASGAPPTAGSVAIAKSTWNVFNGSDTDALHSIAISTCGGKCDFPVAGLSQGNYYATLEITNTEGQSATALRNFSVTPVGTHLACASNACTVVSGPGASSCATNNDCVNPPPTITNVVPSDYPATSTSQTMTVNGSNFQNGATLTFVSPEGGAIASVVSKLIFVSSGQLNYQFNNQSDSGAWSVTVTNPDGQKSNTASFTVTAGGGSSHAECGNSVCVQVSGSGTNRCASDPDCGGGGGGGGGGNFHGECDTVQQACVNVAGVGTSTCSADTCGVPRPTHLECQNSACVIVDGGGANTCGAIGSSCGGLPPSCTFAASPASIAPPASSNLSWNCQNVTSCSSINPGGLGPFAASGNVFVHPTFTTTYFLSCSGSGGNATFPATVKVANPGVIEVVP